MQIGLIGLGRMGCLQLSLLERDEAVKHIWAYDPIAQDNPADKCTLVKDIETLLAKSLDGLIIASPSEMHLDHIKQAAPHHKYIFCEKPIGLSIPQIEKTLLICRHYNTYLQVGFNRRFDIGVSNLKEEIPLHVETPQVIKITSRDPELPPKSYLKNAGHLFMDMSIHDFDMARFLAGSEVTEVFAFGSCLIDKSLQALDDIDTAVIQLKFENGAMAVIDNSRRAVYGYDQRIEVFSNKATLKTGNQLKDKVECYSDKYIATSTLKPFFVERYETSYERQLADFISSIRDKRVPKVTGFDGLQAVKIALAAKDALSKRQVVKLDNSIKTSQSIPKNMEEAYDESI